MITPRVHDNVKFELYRVESTVANGFPVVSNTAVATHQIGAFDSNIRTATPSVQNLGDSNRSIEAMLFVNPANADYDSYAEGLFVKITHKLHRITKSFVTNTDTTEQYLIIGMDTSPSESGNLITLYLARKDSGA